MKLLPCKIMDMYLFVPLVYFSCIQASWCYFVSNATATWTEQYAECKMATPTIKYEGLELDVTFDQQFQNQKLWIGYYQYMALFDYIGCLKTRNVKSNLTTITLGVPTPGRCFSACAFKQYIGINKRECYCFDTKPGGNNTEQGCNLPCDDMSQTVCGGKDHISLYTPSTKDTDLFANSGNDKCLQIKLKPQGERYHWKTCSKTMWASCSSDSQQTVEILEKSLTWINAARLCFKRNLYPARLENIDLVNKTDFYSWTGVIRSSVISKYTALGNISSDILYGYMTSGDTSGYVLRFTQTNDNKQSLCENGIVTASPKAPWRTATTITTQAFHSTTSRDDSNDNITDTQRSDVTLYVIVSVLFVMLIAVVIIISIQVRRKKIPLLCQRKKTTNEQGKKHSKRRINQASFGNPSYEHVDVDDNDKCVQSADSNYIHTYDAPEELANDSVNRDTTYDVSGDNRKTTKTESENIYNKLKQPDDSATYDHAYNATQHGLQTLDVTYDTTSGDAAMRSPVTDNVYSAHDQARHDTKNVVESHNNSEDTYSQINNPKKRK